MPLLTQVWRHINFFRATNKSNKPIKIINEKTCHALLLRIKKVNLMLMI